MWAIRDTMRLRRGGLLWGGVPCCSWIWVSSGTHGRYISIMGDQRTDFVRSGNCISTRFTMLAMLALVLGCNYAVEQPSSSLLIYWPYIQFLVSRYAAAFQRFWMSTFNHWSAKPSYVFGLAKWINDIPSKRTAGTKSHPDMVKKTISKSGRKSVAGGPSLKKSGEYPEAFAAFVLRQHMEHEEAPEFPQPDATWVPATAPFGWEHANLGPLRDMLVAARDEGRFHPNPSLPL